MLSLVAAGTLATSGLGASEVSVDLHAYEIALPEPAPAVDVPSREARIQAWRAFRDANGAAWKATWDEVTGTPRRLVGSGPEMVSPRMSPETVDQVSRAFLTDNADLFGVDIGNLALLSARNGAGVWFVTYQQMHMGLPVVGGRVDLRFGRTGHLILISASVYPDIDVVTTPGLDAATAYARAVADFPPSWGPVPWGEAELGVVPVFNGWRYEYRLTQRVVARVEEPAGGWESLVDARTGEVLQRTNLVRYVTIDGTSAGDVQEATPFDPYVELGLADQRVVVGAVGETFTASDGSFSIEVPNASPRNVQVPLAGRWIDVNYRFGTDALINTTGVPGIPMELRFDDTNSHPAERNTFFYGTLAHNYIKAVDPGLTGIDFELTAWVNRGDGSGECSAWFDPFAPSINFRREGPGCPANWGQIATMIYHEYGHLVTFNVYDPVGAAGGYTAAMFEGFADFFSNTISDQPLVAPGAAGPGTYRRNSDNDRQWPASECNGEVHCEGEVIAGALWHMRENLIDAFGDHDAAVAHTDSLFHFAQYGVNTCYESYYFDVLAVDDDNGTLLDGTPNAIPIIQAFDRHNIGPGYVLDILHAPLVDTEDSTSVAPVHAVFASPFPLVGDSLAVYYRTDGGPFQRLAMAPTGAPREYVAEIPALPHGTTVDYYIVGAADSLLASLPEGAPAQTFTFRVGVDADAPVITHTPAGDAAGCQWPTTIVAEVTDNLAVDEVVLEFSIDGESQAPVVMMYDAATDAYVGTFTGSAPLGGAIEYRIRATDTAGIPNTSYDPSTGYHAFTLGDLLVEMDVESGPQGWTHAVVTEGYVDQWHISSERNTTPGGSSSWKFGDTGSGGYAIMADGALVMPPVTLGAGATMTFSDSLDAWPWSSSIAADGAVVELSTDGGSSWELIEPVGGYSHQSGGFTPFPADYTCWSGWHDWREETFLLDAFAGETVTIRFRFASWGYGVYDGWYVDDVVLTPNCTLVDVEPDVAVRTTALRGVSPNPFNPVTTVRYELAEDAQVSLRVFDAAGRRVRTLVERTQSPGHYRLRWDGNGDAGARVASGVYWLRMTTSSGHRETTKMVLLK